MPHPRPLKQCAKVKADGHRCGRNHRGLSDYCWQHGGRTPAGSGFRQEPTLPAQVERELAKVGVFRRSAAAHLGRS